MCLTEKNLCFVYIQEHIGMTNVKILTDKSSGCTYVHCKGGEMHTY
jgi:hypothetical protein